jgi:hypothetical protein
LTTCTKVRADEFGGTAGAGVAAGWVCAGPVCVVGGTSQAETLSAANPAVIHRIIWKPSDILLHRSLARRAKAASPNQESSCLEHYGGTGHLKHMFSIEHDFDATVITLIDDGAAPLQEDVTVRAFAECITVEQYDPRTDQAVRLTFSPEQVRDLAAALDLPEGIYKIARENPAG